MMNPMKTILVGIDFSEGSARALEYAAGLAEKLSARLDLLYMLDIPPPSWEAALASLDDGDVTQRALEQLRQLRDKIVTERVPAWLHVRPGHAVTGFLAAIEELKPDLVVVGTHGRGALARMLMGSVSERLCRTSTVPVLVVPAPSPVDKKQEASADGMLEATLPPGKDIAWSCASCGHIRGKGQSLDRCGKCGQSPGKWNSAPVTPGPVDQLEPAMSSGLLESAVADRAQEPGGLFATSPGGTQGYSINAELRVRY